MKLPMREKYVDEAVGIFMVLGQYTDGSVDVMDDRAKDIFTHIPRDVAEKVVAAHNEFRNKMYELLCK